MSYRYILLDVAQEDYEDSHLLAPDSVRCILITYLQKAGRLSKNV